MVFSAPGARYLAGRIGSDHSTGSRVRGKPEIAAIAPGERGFLLPPRSDFETMVPEAGLRRDSKKQIVNIA